MEAIILKPSSKESSKKEVLINREIRAQNVRLILETGENLGVVSLNEALSRAQEVGLDLVEISAQTEVPVCKIIDFGKYKYELQKKKNEAKKRQKTIDLKEIKISPTIESHDYEVKLKRAQKFIAEGNKVKWTLRFRGREVVYKDRGFQLMKDVYTDLESIAKIEQAPKLEGKQMGMIVAPK
ncbi:MAG: translation initiation factor IF-3 [Alphaproteobacteria bacterium]|nr:translation initiation factor IF-3 [Alphaproteobacteria bacterium]